VNFFEEAQENHRARFESQCAVVHLEDQAPSTESTSNNACNPRALCSTIAALSAREKPNIVVIGLHRSAQGRGNVDALLKCKVTPGQFSDELAVNCEKFSLFAPRSLVELTRDQQPSANHPAEAWLRVRLIDRSNGKALVRLPNEALEIGYLVWVDSQRVKVRGQPGQTDRP
jgi:hypothetical protein